jgi:hypothetical protein
VQCAKHFRPQTHGDFRVRRSNLFFGVALVTTIACLWARDNTNLYRTWQFFIFGENQINNCFIIFLKDEKDVNPNLWPVGVIRRNNDQFVSLNFPFFFYKYLKVLSNLSWLFSFIFLDYFQSCFL